MAGTAKHDRPDPSGLTVPMLCQFQFSEKVEEHEFI